MPSNNCAVLCATTSFFAVFVAGLILIVVATMPSREYSVAIDTVSGLDLPAAPQLDPQFNLTLRLTSTNPLHGECMGADTYLEVSYRCTRLATTTTTASHRLCVGPKKSTEARFVAKGTGIRLPGPLMDSLTADMRSRTAAFGVRLLQSGGGFWVASCGARRVGDGGSWCNWWDMCAPPQDRRASDAMIFYTPSSIPPED
jgi:hypothetical protein